MQKEGNLLREAQSSLVNQVSELYRYRELLNNLVSRDLKVRYKRSILGVTWTMLNPLLMMLVFSVIFATIMRAEVAHYTTYFLAGFLVWNFFAQATNVSMMIILGNAGLIKRVYMPKVVFVLAGVISGLINFLIALLPLILVMLVDGVRFTPALLFVPVALLFAAIFTLGMSLLLASGAVFFNDITQLYQVILTMWMYLSGIFYPLSWIPERYRFLVLANPMYHLVQCFRVPIVNGTLPAPETILWSVASAVIILAIGLLVFSRSADRFALYV